MATTILRLYAIFIILLAHLKYYSIVVKQDHHFISHQIKFPLAYDVTLCFIMGWERNRKIEMKTPAKTKNLAVSNIDELFEAVGVTEKTLQASQKQALDQQGFVILQNVVD